MSLSLQAQMRWVNPLEAGAGVQGQGWEDINKTYVRLPDKAKDTVRGDVWSLSRNSAGLSLVFRSNAPEMKVRYKVQGGLSMYHMPSTGVSGVDMYATDADGVRRWCAPDFTATFTKDSIVYRYSQLDYFPDGASSYEYHLYLPLYNTVEWLEIGVPEGAELEFYPASKERPIVVYGTSIAQGACASRPGNCWPNIVERELEHPLVNLGFSGNGKLEPELFTLLGEIDACIYIIDCMPNLHADRHPVYELAMNGMHMLREARPDCPILLVEHSGYMNEVSNLSRSEYRKTNSELRRAYNDLMAEGCKELYYLTSEEIGLGMDGMVEGVHPNDLGMRRQADAIEKKVCEILHETTVPYAPCKTLSGSAGSLFDNGTINLGGGSERIENTLWRIFHGGIDGCQARSVYIQVSDSNFATDPVEKIADGINQIVEAVAVRQPGAKIHVCGVRPGSGNGKKAELLNEVLQYRLHTDKADYMDTTK